MAVQSVDVPAHVLTSTADFDAEESFAEDAVPTATAAKENRLSFSATTLEDHLPSDDLA